MQQNVPRTHSKREAYLDIHQIWNSISCHRDSRLRRSLWRRTRIRLRLCSWQSYTWSLNFSARDIYLDVICMQVIQTYLVCWSYGNAKAWLCVILYVRAYTNSTLLWAPFCKTCSRAYYISTCYGLSRYRLMATSHPCGIPTNSGSWN